MRILVSGTLVVTFCAINLSFGVAAIPGRVIVSRGTGEGVIVWGASVEGASIVANKTADSPADNKLERDALKILGPTLSGIDKSARTVTVRIVYYKTGAVSPVYGSPTFVGIERYATVEISYRDALKDRDKW